MQLKCFKMNLTFKNYCVASNRNETESNRKLAKPLSIKISVETAEKRKIRPVRFDNEQRILPR